MNWQMHIIVRVPVEVWLNVSRRQASNGGMIDLMMSYYRDMTLSMERDVLVSVPVGKAYVL